MIIYYFYISKEVENIVPYSLSNFTECKDEVNSSFNGNRGKLNFVSILTNLFAAGSDTTSNTILYILWYLCKHPNVQAKIHHEIVSVVGKSRLPR